jgi:anhydro-N-acetylmuramic acid kinase
VTDPQADTSGQLFLGLISGTSADAIDAALVRFTPKPVLVAARAVPYPAQLRHDILALSQAREAVLSLDQAGTLDAAIGEAFAAAANALIETAAVARHAIAAIGSHGQTLRHRPRSNPAFTTQWGDPSRIVERTGITTVADFRRRDLAAGGEGAPLLPPFHAACFSDPGEDRAVLNLGGIANFTLLPRDGAVRGFDTGPANALLDAWCESNGNGSHDVDGRLAAAGKVDAALLAQLVADPYFARPAPKSTGREHFHLDWLRAQFRGPAPALADGAATLTALTAVTVASALKREGPETRRVIVCGGGTRNPTLMRAVSEALAPVAVEPATRFGVDPDFIEAMAFAWLARETLAGRPGNLPAVTGARGPRVLGAIYPA